jgi:V/A-type H+-transporting ATPase subunit G/H
VFILEFIDFSLGGISIAGIGMELIKKIKEAETQAQEIIEQAKVEVAEQEEKSRENRRQLLEEAEQQRKKATEAAVAAARELGHAEVEKLEEQAENRCRQLRDQTSGKIATAAAKVMEYLGSHFVQELQNEGSLRG